ncbi:hypothetical protein BGZ58_000102 [Dissophora ornata]|nr:hypothetical protein BGZ58_000102 [Dissophora ornata]
MIPIRRTALVLSRTWNSAQLATYTTRSNGAAFLNNLDFLAPAPSSRSSSPAPSQPTLFQQTKSNAQRQQTPHGVKRDFLKGSFLSSQRDADDFDSDLSSASGKSRRANSLEDLGKRPALDRARRDEEIDSQWIQYITPEGKRVEKTLSSVLKTFDRSEFFLIEVDSRSYPPVCKLATKRELYEKAKHAKQAKKSNVLQTKELQLNWGTDAHDLSHKLSKCRGFLEKGYRLDVQINGKKGKSTTPQEREAVLERVKAEFEPVAKYVKQPEWVKATTVTMFLQGITKKAERPQKQEQQEQQE